MHQSHFVALVTLVLPEKSFQFNEYDITLRYLVDVGKNIIITDRFVNDFVPPINEVVSHDRCTYIYRTTDWFVGGTITNISIKLRTYKTYLLLLM